MVSLRLFGQALRVSLSTLINQQQTRVQKQIHTGDICMQEDAYQDYMYGDPDVAAAYDLDMDIMDASMDGAELGDSMDPAIQFSAR